MKITLIQPELQWNDFQTNMATAAALIDEAPDSDLYVLPEMWATGFEVHPTAKTRLAAETALRWMQEQADERQAAIAGSLACDESVSEAGTMDVPGWRNRFFFVKPGGQKEWYDKMHLFTLSDEPLSFVPGAHPRVTEWRGVRFRLQVCFDLRFPEAARQSSEMPYDILLNVANWPESRQSAREILLKARAIENQAYVVGVNCVGDYGKIHHAGHSVALDAWGQELVNVGEQKGFATFEPDIPALQLYRMQFPMDY